MTTPKWYPPAKKSSWNPIQNFINAVRNATSRREYLNQRKREEEELMKQDRESARNKARTRGYDTEFRTRPPSVPAKKTGEPPEGSYNVSPHGSRRRKEVEAQIKKDIQARASAAEKAKADAATNTSSGGDTRSDRGGDSNGDGAVRLPTTKFDGGNNTGSSSGIERRTPTSRELKAAQTARKLYRKSNPSDFAGAEKAAIRASLNPSSVLKTSNGSEKMTSNTGLPRLDAALSGSKSEFKFNSPDNRKKKTNEQMDTFDTIKEYLLSEGYAASEGAAHAIMTSMSEEWKQSILEQMLPPIDPKKHRAAQKTQKIYNKATQGAGSEKDFLRRTGPQLPGV